MSARWYALFSTAPSTSLAIFTVKSTLLTHCCGVWDTPRTAATPRAVASSSLATWWIAVPTVRPSSIWSVALSRANGHSAC